MSWAEACSHRNKAHAQASLLCPNEDVHHTYHETDQSRPAEDTARIIRYKRIEVTLQSLYILAVFWPMS